MHDMKTRNQRSVTQDMYALNVKPARNILELDKKFETVYTTGGNQLTATARSQSHYFNSKMDRKISNIMFKLNTQFNKQTHKERNEEIVKRMRDKHNRMQVDLPMHMMNSFPSQDLDVVTTYQPLKTDESVE